MKKGPAIIFAVAIVLVLEVIWWGAPSRPSTVPDPVYAGRHLSYWLAPSAFTGRNFAPRELLFIHTSIDSNAVPYLVQALKTRDGTLRVADEHLWSHFPIWLKARVPYLASAAELRRQSCFFLEVLGVTARPAVPELTRVLRQDESEPVRNGAVYALWQIARSDDKGVVDALITAAKKDPDPNLQGNAREILVRFNPEAAAHAGLTNAAAGAGSITNSAGRGR
jgi:hypothetical protein